MMAKRMTAREVVENPGWDRTPIVVHLTEVELDVIGDRVYGGQREYENPVRAKVCERIMAEIEALDPLSIIRARKIVEDARHE